MKNTSLRIISLGILCSAFFSTLFSQTTVTYDFSNAASLSSDWTIASDIPSGGSGTCEVSNNIGGSIPLPPDGSSYLGFTFLNKSGITHTITTTASYQNISNISAKACASDNSKPTIQINIVDDQGNIVATPLSAVGTKDGFSTGGTKKWGSKDVNVSPVVSGHVQFVLYASSSGKYAALDDIVVTYSGGAPAPSSDATLSELKYDGTAIPGFNASTLTYSVELPATYSGIPTLTATTNDANAQTTITQATAIPGTATVVVTAEDGNTTKTYTVTFTRESADPSITAFTIAGVNATIDPVAKTITATVPNGTDVTALTPTVSGKNISSYTPTGAQNFTNPVTYTVSSAGGTNVSYTVTITVAPPQSADATLRTLTVGSRSISLQSGVYAYSVDAVAGDPVPQVVATANDTKATVSVTQASSLSGSATVVVTAENGTQLIYTITFNVTVPTTTLTLHEPGIFEEKSIAGGYGGKLTAFNGREYEVYYSSRDADSKATVTVSAPAQKTDGITKPGRSATQCEAIDGWFKIEMTSISNYTFTANEEFAAGAGAVHKLTNNNTFQLHISGYDQFTIFAKDNNTDVSKGKHFEVYIDGILQPKDKLSTTASLRRYDLNTGEHLIEVKGIGGSNNELYGFSLRVSDEPRTKYLSGNDSTQLVYITQSMKPVTYYTKYNNRGRTVLEWQGGATVSGISLQTTGSSAIGDTLVLSGTPIAPVGVYTYKVVAYNSSNVVTNSVAGTLAIATKITAQTDTVQNGYTGEAIDEFIFRYYAQSSTDVTLTWTNSAPAGISGTGNDNTHTYTISGTPTAPGNYPFTISVSGGNTIQGELRVTTFDPGNNPILYLYKNGLSYEKDGVYQYLLSKGKNLIPRKAKSDGLREASQYAKYKWVIISEDVDADNPEIMALAKGKDIAMPVLNLKSFSYSESRLDWGDPDNGSIINKAVTVVQPEHPIIKAMGKKAGDQIQVLDSVNGKGLMPAAVDYQGTLCLATAFTRGEDYETDGKAETFLHEVPAAMRGGAKYICFPLAIASSKFLSAAGKALLDACVDYLTNSAQTIALPQLEITSFAIDGKAATIFQAEDSIFLQLPEGSNLSGLVPSISLNNPTTHVTCKQADETGAVDFSSSRLKPIVFTVSDFINVRHYNVVVTAIVVEGIEEVYQTGEWVNIYDIHGRMLTTTNEDIYQMELPQGIYLIQTARGSFKVMK